MHLKAYILSFSFLFITGSLAAQYNGGSGDGYDSEGLTNVVLSSDGEDLTTRIHMAPNPVKSGNEIHVYFGPAQTTTYSLRMFDSSGRLIRIVKLTGPELEISTIGLSAGLYLLQFFSGDTTYQSKFLITS